MQQTLALKYRPRQFADLIGQKAVSESLSFVLNSNKIGNAYLFSGLRGSGKTTSARIFAKALICEKGISATPCEECSNCIQANENRHIDIVEMDAASNRKIDDIRDLIELTKYAPSTARFKIFILDEAHMLTKEASNALLKTLEEPPSYVKFILATTDPLKLLPTILSRTQHFRFGAIARAQICARLEYILQNEQIAYEPKAVGIIARCGRGSLRDAITLLEQAASYSKRNITQDSVVEMLNLADPKLIDNIFKTIISGDLVELIQSLEGFEADMLISEMIESLKEQLLSKESDFSLLSITRFFKILSNAKSLLENGADGEFVLYITLFNLREALSVLSSEGEEAGVQANFNASEAGLAKNFAGGVAAAASNKQASLSAREPLPPRPAPSNQNTPRPTSHEEAYKKFVNKIYDRSIELGECFDEHLGFIKFENDELILSYQKTQKASEMLRANGKFITQVLREFFGANAVFKPVVKTEQTPLQSVLNGAFSNSNSVLTSTKTAGDEAQNLSKPNLILAPQPWQKSATAEKKNFTQTSVASQNFAQTTPPASQNFTPPTETQELPEADFDYQLDESVPNVESFYTNEATSEVRQEGKMNLDFSTLATNVKPQNEALKELDKLFGAPQIKQN